MFDETPGGRFRVGGKLVNAEGEPLKGAAAEVDTQEESTNGTSDLLDGVQFASAAAHTAAEEAGMTAADFAGKKGSSADGFTKPDVMALIESQNVGEEG